MSLTEKVLQTSDTKLNTSNKTTLNPNAVEFIPFSLRSPSSGNTGSFNTTKLVASSSTVGKAGLGRSESSTSRHSEEEAQQYWQNQLPDDITPDFKVPAEDDDPQALGSLSLAGLSLHGNHETPEFPTSAAGGYGFLDHPQFLTNGNSLSEKMRYSTSTYGEDPAQTSFLHQAQKPWDNQIGSNDQLLSGNLEGHPYGGISRHGLMNDMINESSTMGDVDMNPVEFLAVQFPGFAAESLAEVYFANGCDLHLTIEMLTQLELQIDGGMDQNMSSKTLPAPSLGALDFPALTAADSFNSSAKYSTRDGFEQTGNPYQSSGNDNMLFFKSSSSAPSRGSLDFATAVRKLASQDSGVWKLERNGSVEPSIGSSRSSNDLASAYGTSVQGKSIFGERFQNRGSARSAPVWVETGDAVGNVPQFNNLLPESTLIGFVCLHIRIKTFSSDQQKMCVEKLLQLLMFGLLISVATFCFLHVLVLIRFRLTANMYSELREEARDHARLRNAYFEQARQAYLIGNKALAKELSAKGQLHNMHMKDAHGKAQEAIFRQRNPVDQENLGGNERMIDLHGLHVSEAIHVLKHKLSLVRGMARAADQRLQVYICVGTGHHTRGSRTPARLPVAIQRYLLEEGLDFTEPQPGLLRVVIY